jgi:hypothetical protein
MFQLRDVAVETGSTTGQRLLLGGRPARGAAAVESGVMCLDQGEGLTLPNQARVLGEQSLSGEDQHLLGLFVHSDLLSEETLWDRIAIGVQMDIALGVHHPVMVSAFTVFEGWVFTLFEGSAHAWSLALGGRRLGPGSEYPGD